MLELPPEFAGELSLGLLASLLPLGLDFRRLAGCSPRRWERSRPRASWLVAARDRARGAGMADRLGKTVRGKTELLEESGAASSGGGTAFSLSSWEMISSTDFPFTA